MIACGSDSVWKLARHTFAVVLPCRQDVGGVVGGVRPELTQRQGARLDVVLAWRILLRLVVGGARHDAGCGRLPEDVGRP